MRINSYRRAPKVDLNVRKLLSNSQRRHLSVCHLRYIMVLGSVNHNLKNTTSNSVVTIISAYPVSEQVISAPSCRKPSTRSAMGLSRMR